MLAQRGAQQSLRRLAASTSKSSIASQMMFKQAAASSLSSQIRPATSSTASSKEMRQIISAAESSSILAKQRLNRPNSPHITIYKPQVTWILSISNRITGGILSAGFYAFGLAYLAAPALGLSFDSASIVAAVASWPVLAKVMAKFAVALPFTFHSFNGIRHFAWDSGRSFKNKVVIRTGWFVVGISVASALGLSVM